MLVEEQPTIDFRRRRSLGPHFLQRPGDVPEVHGDPLLIVRQGLLFQTDWVAGVEVLLEGLPKDVDLLFTPLWPSKTGGGSPVHRPS